MAHRTKALKRLNPAPVLLVLALGVVLATGCDRAYPTHVAGNVSAGGLPSTGYVVPLVTSPQALGLDRAGRFDATYGGLNLSPSSIPLLIYVPGATPILLMPDRDFTLQKRGDEWAGKVDVDLAHVRKPTPLIVSCVSGSCSFDLLSDADRCLIDVFAFGGPRLARIANTSRWMTGRRTVSFDVAATTADVVVAVACGGAGVDYTWSSATKGP